MTELNCQCCRPSCITGGLILSIILGVLVSFLTITGMLTIPAFLLTAAFIVALVYLPVLLIARSLRGGNSAGCVCRSINTLLIAILGTVITAAILLSITFPATSIIGAIIAGLLTLFFFLILTATACLIRCISNCDD